MPDQQKQTIRTDQGDIHLSAGKDPGKVHFEGPSRADLSQDQARNLSRALDQMSGGQAGGSSSGRSST